jgi:hypothetical protein
MPDPVNVSSPDESLPVVVVHQLFLAWAFYLAREQFGIGQHGSAAAEAGHEAYMFGDPLGDGFVIAREQSVNEWSLSSCNGLREEAVLRMLTEAAARTAAGNFGSDVVYEVQLQTADVSSLLLTPFAHFQRLLGDQVPIRGWRRLSDRVLLEFSDDIPEDLQRMLFATLTTVRVLIFAPGPVQGFHTDKLAGGMSELTAAVCSLALGRFARPTGLLDAAEADSTRTAEAKRGDVTVLGLARDGISLDVFGEFPQLGGPEGVLRLRGALLAYGAALEQSSPDVATLLFVTAIEALLRPNQPWAKERLTKRFVESVQLLCPETVDELVNHGNTEQAFGYKRKTGLKAQRRQFLNHVYDVRSRPAHEGLSLTGGATFPILGDPATMRLALLSYLARAAILNFIQAPRSFLYGHPLFDGAETQEPTNC